MESWQIWGRAALHGVSISQPAHLGGHAIFTAASVSTDTPLWKICIGEALLPSATQCPRLGLSHATVTPRYVPLAVDAHKVQNMQDADSTSRFKHLVLTVWGTSRACSISWPFCRSAHTCKCLQQCSAMLCHAIPCWPMHIGSALHSLQALKSLTAMPNRKSDSGKKPKPRSDRIIYLPPKVGATVHDGTLACHCA